MTRQVATQSEHDCGKLELYEIRFKGHLSSYRAGAFEGLEVVAGPAGETVLTGPVIDQAALHGVLDRISELGVPLLSVRRLPADEAPAGRSIAEQEVARPDLEGCGKEQCSRLPDEKQAAGGA